MKTKEEILKMNDEELINYKWNDDLDKEVNFDCYNCRNCRNCLDCLNCSYCRNIEDKKYCICNVQLTEEEYKKKIKELKEEQK